MANAIMNNEAGLLLDILLPTIGNPGIPLQTKAAFLAGLTTLDERRELVARDKVRKEILKTLGTPQTFSIKKTAENCGVSAELVARVLKAIRDDYPPNDPPADSFCVAVPKETRARVIVEDILGKGDFLLEGRQINDIRGELPPISVRMERGQDVLTYMQAGAVQFAFAGSDKTREVLNEESLRGRNPLQLDILQAFRTNGFRMCLAVPEKDETIAKADLAGFLREKKIATSYPCTLRTTLQARGIEAGEIIFLKGNVETAPRDLGVSAIFDVVETGGSLRRNNLIGVAEISQCAMELFALQESPVAPLFKNRINAFCARLQNGEAVANG